MTEVLDRLSKETSMRGQMQRAVLRVLLDHAERGELPTSGRFVFYELEGKGIVRKSRQGESRRGRVGDPREQEVTDALIYLRDNGVIPWSWLVDETRTLYEWNFAGSVTEYMVDRLEEARISPWDGSPPLLIVESRSLGGVLRSMVADYLCSIAATNGQVGGFLHTELVPLLTGNDRPILYLGDWDHQGHQIEANTRRVLEQVTDRSLDWSRVAITEEQIDERGLEPIWKTDYRYKPPLETEAWECEALGQGMIQELVRDALDELLPVPLSDVLEQEHQERLEFRSLLNGHSDLDGGVW